MVYCTKCGYKNEDNAEVCEKCGASLKISPVRRPRTSDGCFGSHEKRREDECFGLPYGGAIAGIIFGVIIIIAGLAIYFGEYIWSILWPFLIIIFGLLIIAGAIYGMRRR